MNTERCAGELYRGVRADLSRFMEGKGFIGQRNACEGAKELRNSGRGTLLSSHRYHTAISSADEKVDRQGFVSGTDTIDQISFDGGTRS